MEILLITTRNIYESTGEFKLIKRRSEELYNQYNIVTKVISFQRQSRIDNSTFEDDSDFQYVIKHGFKNLSFVLDLIRFKRKLKKYLYKYKPKKIILSGKHMLFFRVIKQYFEREDCELYLDVHGCNEEIIEYGTGHNIKNKIKLYLNDIYDSKILSICSGVLVVSETLKDHMINKYNLKRNYFHIIPCGNYGTINSFEERLKYRKIWREKMGIEKDETVFVYSGGISEWQKVDETVHFLYEVSKKYQNATICIFSGQIEEICKKVNSKDFKNKIILRSLKSSDVPLALTACDIGVILRDNNITNWVAFPTKFADYIEGGLHVILTSVKSQIDYINKYNLGLAYQQISDLTSQKNDSSLQKIIGTRKESLLQHYKKCDYIINEQLNYAKTIKSFAEKIIEND